MPLPFYLQHLFCGQGIAKFPCGGTHSFLLGFCPWPCVLRTSSLALLYFGCLGPVLCFQLTFATMFSYYYLVNTLQAVQPCPCSSAVLAGFAKGHSLSQCPSPPPCCLPQSLTDDLRSPFSELPGAPHPSWGAVSRPEAPPLALGGWVLARQLEAMVREEPTPDPTLPVR